MATSAASSSRSSAGGYPSSAAAFAARLGLSNLDLATFLPIGFLGPATNFYDLLVVKTLAPLAVVGLLWLPALHARVTGKPVAPAARSAAQSSLLVAELFVSSVSTALAQTFRCDTFDDGSFLAVELTLACDASAQRRDFVRYASCMILLYPVGKPPPPSPCRRLVRHEMMCDRVAVGNEEDTS